MNTTAVKEILHEHQLRITAGRCDVIKLFLASSYALSAKDLENQLPQYDRVTLYRTLHTFIEKGILHLIPHDGGLAYFGLSGTIRQRLTNQKPPTAVHHSDHIHFTCTVCGRTECLPEHLVPKITLPKNYQIDEVALVVKGQCQACYK
ncbi:Fur family transcriptional regulator [Tunicatimonas pelagia]|uniref:Fur family transcriptional regulator n=1 Tax=Tunicatimonas pelagia TaxID=931531 RepID=UPI0026658453|nr:transcriptional repressor [Tunicatimonas pelagia]WKN41893.1 transcriptional repressor [Tunicatimonas pelagia]